METSEENMHVDTGAERVRLQPCGLPERDFTFFQLSFMRQLTTLLKDGAS